MSEKFRGFKIVDGVQNNCDFYGPPAKYNFRGIRPGQCFVSEIKNLGYLRRRASTVNKAWGVRFSVYTEGDFVYVCNQFL